MGKFSLANVFWQLNRTRKFTQARQKEQAVSSQEFGVFLFYDFLGEGFGSGRGERGQGEPESADLANLIKIRIPRRCSIPGLGSCALQGCDHPKVSWAAPSQAPEPFLGHRGSSQPSRAPSAFGCCSHRAGGTRGI